MSDYRARVTEDLRLVVLLLLEQAPGYEANVHVLRSALGDFGHRPSADTLRSELAWLTEQRLATTRIAGVLLAKLTERGADVAAGRAIVPGVKRPAVGAAAASAVASAGIAGIVTGLKATGADGAK